MVVKALPGSTRLYQRWYKLQNLAGLRSYELHMETTCTKVHKDREGGEFVAFMPIRPLLHASLSVIWLLLAKYYTSSLPVLYRVYNI